jgi:sodium/proline symporter
LRASQAAVVLMAFVAGMIAMDPASRVLALVAYAWAGLGASLGPLMLFALFWRRTTRVAGLLGMLAGGATVMVWGALEGGVFDLYELLPGFVIASTTIAIGSILTPRDDLAERVFDGFISAGRAPREANPADP